MNLKVYVAISSVTINIEDLEKVNEAISNFKDLEVYQFELLSNGIIPNIAIYSKINTLMKVNLIKTFKKLCRNKIRNITPVAST